MGFLKILGKALEFNESKEHFEFMREHAVAKFIELITEGKIRENTETNIFSNTKYGFEVKFNFIILLDGNSQSPFK
jgi:hypothetical protein